jgi:hypothetical protein
MFYDKLGMYDEAISICQLAIQKGLTDSEMKTTMYDRVERLQKKRDKKKI